VAIDSNRCTGNGRCYTLAPSVFEADDEGFVVGRGAIVDVPPGEEPAVQLAVDNCPEAALRIEQVIGET
jgi:ferredoxin